AVNELSLSELKADPNVLVSSGNDSENPMIAALRDSMLRLQQSLAEMKARSEEAPEPVDVEFEHMLSLVKMIDGLAKKKET
ncbi:MAG: hypothetical protein ACPGRR_03020, partial [Pseudoalteromonas shioyasakiensis]